MKDEKVLDNLKNAKDILVEDIQDFTRKQKEVMTEYYLYNLTHSYMDNLIVDNKINPNDKIVNRDEIISEFKKNAEFKDEFEPETGYYEQVWVVNDDFKKLHDPEITKVFERMQNLKYEKADLQDKIFLYLYAEKNNGIKIHEGSAVELIEKLDTASYVDFLTSKTKIMIASLTDNEQELEDLRYKIEDENPYIINYKLLGDKKHMLEFSMSNNGAYAMFPEWLKESLVNQYYENTRPSEQLSLMGTTATIDRESVSLLATDIMKKRSGREFDLVDHPEIYDNFIYFQGILKNISSVIKEEVANDTFNIRKTEEYISPLTNIILMGGIDSESQRERFGKEMEKFSNDISDIVKINKNFESNYVASKIDTILDDVIFERETTIYNKKERIVERLILDDKFKKDLPKEIAEMCIREIKASQKDEISNDFIRVISNNKDNDISKRVLNDNTVIKKMLEKFEDKKKISRKM